MKAETVSLYHARRCHSYKSELPGERKRRGPIPAGFREKVQRLLPSPRSVPPLPASGLLTCCVEEVVNCLQQGFLEQVPGSMSANGSSPVLIYFVFL